MTTLLLAETWGIPPWEIEDKADWQWVERWEALQEARQTKDKKPGGETRSGSTITRKTVV